MMKRCPWANQSQLEQVYHDSEWGRPVRDDAILFEFLVLEMMQAGLAWRIILQKREAMRFHFDNFNAYIISKYRDDKINQLMQEPSIIRNRRKLNAMINNAIQFLKIQKEFKSFSNYLWSFTDYVVVDNTPEHPQHIPTQNELSHRISQDLRQRGFQFLGPTIMYSYLEAVGVINNHLKDCFVRKEVNLGK